MPRKLGIYTYYQDKLIGNVNLSIVHQIAGLICHGQMDDSGKTGFIFEGNVDIDDMIFVAFLKKDGKTLVGCESFQNKSDVIINLEEYAPDKEVKA